jgi:hypothetical protein
VCATYSTGTLKATAVEIMIRKALTIDQLKHTKLICHYITFGINSVTVNVSGRTIIATDEQTIIFD